MSDGQLDGITEAFRGPFADGPPPEALSVEAPPLEELKVSDLGRLMVVAGVVTSSVLRSLAARTVRRRPATMAEAACDGLIDAFIALGPTYVKAGQIIASSAALFPPVLSSAARRCLDAVPPFPTDQVHRAIEEDLGRPVEELFVDFDDTALAAASIGQVHACTLPGGRHAVVKVQRPELADHMATDLRIGYRLAGWFERTKWGRTSGARRIIEDLHDVTFQELNPALEAWRQDRFRENIWFFGDNEMVTAPSVYWDYCGPRTICMERVFGIPMDRFEEMQASRIDGQAILRRGAKVWAEAVMVHGPFHGDMHAANIWALDDGRCCYLDFGIMGELSEPWQALLKDLFFTCAFDLDFVRVARAYRRVGAVPPGAGSDEELGQMLGTILGGLITEGFGGLNIADLVGRSIEMMSAYDATTPSELVLIAKQLLYIDKYTKHLAPGYSITADPYILKNIFPEQAAARATELGIDLEDRRPRETSDHDAP